jgi:hypothetical protein
MGTEVPMQMAVLGDTSRAGFEMTATVTVAVCIQPLAVVPVTVYVVVVAGEASTVAPVVASSPVAGDQL